ncbi:MAG: ABC transporter ATP-binding protein [Nitrospirae bacterium]|nr:MAG: ABC transporter ATP-binding protein [Nitrospirota bacterium]
MEPLGKDRLLSIQSLSYRSDGKEILKDLHMEVRRAEIHALLGTNGTGKSTLAYLIMGTGGYRPTEGKIIFEGRDINDLSVFERAELGITLAWQEPVRFEGITVRQYLEISSRGSNPSECLEMVGLHPELYLDRMVDRSLSGGERKRIELASVIAMRPKLAILDEPDSGIDMLSTEDIINVLKALKGQGSSVLLITHREEIALCADRASQLCRGSIFISGRPEDVARAYKNRLCLRCDGITCRES